MSLPEDGTLRITASQWGCTCSLSLPPAADVESALEAALAALCGVGYPRDALDDAVVNAAADITRADIELESGGE